MEQLDKVLVVIPAYNEEANIELVVEELIRDYPDLDYVVVNDGSRDRTAEICREKGYNLQGTWVLSFGSSGKLRAGGLLSGWHEVCLLSGICLCRSV